ncbi:phage tail assembly chaperone [Gellertiella hungarica]|uniref:Uncharacterized protein n=1 Tax=Gellertiella hungarica TaxID=1572859 RepID=A0A7W6J2R7_9HYPH|nr:hypothetical protein [Gellertiella hungarica]MBB4063688.1 hypothetical protein [Gellertiella hungarica]
MAEKKIGGSVYKVEPMLATQAIILQARLARVIGPAISKLPGILASRKEGASDEQKAQADADAVSAVTEIFSRCPPHEIAELVKDVVEVAMVQRPSGVYEPVDFDLDFTGRLGDVIPTVVFVLATQFGDFFSGALANGRPTTRAKA